MKVHFDELFMIGQNVITPLHTIRIQGLAFGPGVSIWKGFSYGGIQFSQLEGQELEVEWQDGGYWLLGVYAPHYQEA